jgi:hypothetical protein
MENIVTFERKEEFFIPDPEKQTLELIKKDDND